MAVKRAVWAEQIGRVLLSALMRVIDRGTSGSKLVFIGRVMMVLSVSAFPTLSWGEALCLSSLEETVTVQAVQQRLELRLSDGRSARLVGVDPALDTPDDPDLGERSRASLAAIVTGHALRIRVLATTPDRWGRLPVFAAPPAHDAANDKAATTDEAGGLAAVVLAAGLGRYRPEAAAHDCRDALLAAEAKARGARLGLWADPYYAVLAVDDRAAFAERAGTVILAEGRLTAVVSGPYRTKLRFAALGRDRHEGIMLAATILPRTMKTFKAAGVDVDTLVGRTILLRGLLDLRFGPQIELDGPDEITVRAKGGAVGSPAPPP